MSVGDVAWWGRLVFYGGAYQALQSEPRADLERTGAFAARFRPEWEDYLRAQFARAREQAREFIDFVEPAWGSAVVEVGAGAGRISFDGGLAARVGMTGQVLLTDPSGTQLNTAIGRAHELSMGWVRALRAPAEDLPLVTGCADLVVGSGFLHFTDEDRAIAEMARVVRPGGVVAISQGLDFAWPGGWWDALLPVRETLDRYGLPMDTVFPRGPELAARFARVGLRILRQRISGPEAVDFPIVDIAIGFWRLNSLVPLMLRGVPADLHHEVQEAFEQRTREVFERTGPEDRRLSIEVLEVVAQKPE